MSNFLNRYPIFKQLYFWVLVSTVFGGCLGYFYPEFGETLKPLGDGFIALVKVFIAPIVFCTVVQGIAISGDIKKVGRIGGKAFLYFETMSQVALLIGLVAVKLIKPGKGFNVDPNTLDTQNIGHFVQKAESQNLTQFILNIIPKTFFDAFTQNGDLLQVLLLAILFGWALTKVKDRAAPVIHVIASTSQILFTIIGGIMKLAPLGAGGAMAFTIAKFGIHSLVPLASLMLTFYITCTLFIIIVLGLVAHFVGFNLFKFLRYIKDEILLVLGTSSSESALVPLMHKLETLGCSKPVVGLVMPAGYSFNLDGTNIYITIAALFIAQACNIELTGTQELVLFATAALTSNGASGVTGAGFVTLAATLAVVPEIPIAGLALILGVDRFMSEARAITNMIGNAIATLVVARWENDLDVQNLNNKLMQKTN